MISPVETLISVDHQFAGFVGVYLVTPSDATMPTALSQNKSSTPKDAGSNPLPGAPSSATEGAPLNQELPTAPGGDSHQPGPAIEDRRQDAAVDQHPPPAVSQ